MDVTQLREALNSGFITSVELVNLYGTRCRTIGVDHCLITEDNFVQALQMAKKADQET